MAQDSPLVFDVIVIGCGPAGGAAAVTAARAGLKTALIDKARFPRQKLCGGLFTGRARSYYQEIFGENPPPDTMIEKSSVSFWQAETDLGTLTNVPPLYLTMRWDLDYGLYRHATAAGVADFTGSRIAALDLKKKEVVLPNGQHLGFRVLIGADGVNSAVARQIFGSAFDHARIGFGLEIEAPASPPDAPVRIDFGAAHWGYGWAFPKAQSTTIGVGGLLAANADMKAAMGDYLQKLGQDCPESAYKGHFIPFGHFRKTPGQGAVLLAGDAAGLVDPITGEGIAFAMKSGQLAALAAAQSLASGDPDKALTAYRDALRPLHRSLRWATRLRPLLFHPRLERHFRSAFQNSQNMKHAYMELMAGERDYPELVWTLLKRLPHAYHRGLFRR